jgi:DNA repair protein RadC
MAVPAESVKLIAFTLLAQFGSYAKAISAPTSELKGIKGLGEEGITALRLVSETMVRTLRAEVKNRPIMSNWESLIKYLTVIFAHEDGTL